MAARNPTDIVKIAAGSRKGRRLAVLAVVALSLGLILLLATGWWQRSHDALTRARRAGVIRIGYAVEPPYAFLTPEGKLTGESPEIARRVAARLGIPRVEWRLVEFGELIEGLQARRFDVIAAGLFITSERQRRVAFSLPTFQVRPGLLVRKGNPLRLHSYADLVRNARACVAVLDGSAEEAHLRQLGCPTERLIRVPDALSGRTAVRLGSADALALSAPTLRWMMLHPIAGMTEMAEPFHDSAEGTPFPPAVGGFAFRQDEPALRRAWDSELARFVGGEEHHRLVRDFGFTPAELLQPAGPLPNPPSP